MNDHPSTDPGPAVVWSACPRCGKERQVVGPRMPAAAWQFMADVTACLLCQMDEARQEDRCPEQLLDGRLPMLCRFGWAHRGRCTPEWSWEGATVHRAQVVDGRMVVDDEVVEIIGDGAGR